MSTSSLRTLRRLLLTSGALALGCLIGEPQPGDSTEEGGGNYDDEPCVSGENNHVIPPGDQCECDVGFVWCNNDQWDLNCCDPNAMETGESGDSGDGDSGDGDGDSGDGDGDSGDGDGDSG